MPKPGALADVRVLEFAQVMAVPTCGLLLADFGADVVKVEPPPGDSFRLGQRTAAGGDGKSFAVFNRGKRSLCLDLTRPEAREVVERLVRAADVVLVSFKPSDLPRYGLAYETLRASNPRLVYLENTPYGPEGPHGEDGGYDVVVQGMSGLGAISASSQGDAPRFVRPAYVDMGTGFLAALAVVAALRHRDRTGEGQRVETSLLSSALALGGNIVHRFEAFDPPRWDAFSRELGEMRASGASFEEQQELQRRVLFGQTPGNIYFRHYRCADGFVSVGCLSPGLYERFRKATGIEDPRQRADFPRDTAEGRAEVDAMLRRAEALFLTRTSAEWIEVLRAGGVPCGRFNFPNEVFDDEQVAANDYLIELEHPTLGRYRTFAPPVRMAASPTRARGPAPLLGADTDAVLAEVGFAPEAIARLREARVAGPRSREE